MDNTKLIRVSHEFHSRLASHGQFGERFEDILIRLLGKKWLNTHTGDRPSETYSKGDVNSKKTRRSLKTDGENNGR